MHARVWRRVPTTAVRAAGLGSNFPNFPNFLNFLNFWGLRHSTDDACCSQMIMTEQGMPIASPHAAVQRK